MQNENMRKHTLVVSASVRTTAAAPGHIRPANPPPGGRLDSRRQLSCRCTKSRSVLISNRIFSRRITMNVARAAPGEAIIYASKLFKSENCVETFVLHRGYSQEDAVHVKRKSRATRLNSFLELNAPVKRVVFKK